MELLERLKAYFERPARLSTDQKGEQADVELRAATAVLLLEAAYGDEEYVWREHRAILSGLERAFGIGRKETLALLDKAGEIRPPVVTLADVTNLIAERYDAQQRMELVTLLWKVVEADAIVEEWEESFANHVASAVGLSAEEAGEARERARRG